MQSRTPGYAQAKQKCWQDALSLATLTLLVLAFFWPLLSGRYWIPWGGGDLVSFLWPTWRFAARSLRQGIFPLWNPTLYAGAPFAADHQSCLFYPIHLLLFLVGGEPSYEVMEGLVVYHIVLAAALMYLLLRDKGLSRTASVFGGLAFTLSDPFITHIGNLNLNATIAYLPALILLADRAFTRRSLHFAAAAEAVLAIAALAGHGQMLLFLGLALAILTLYRIYAARRLGVRAAAGVAALAAIVVLVGMAAAAVALYPAYELGSHTARAGLSWAEATRYSLPWQALVGLVVPGFYGRGPQNFWGSWDRVEVGYVGVLTLALAVAGLLAGRRKESPISTDVGQFPAAFFALLVVVGFALALGGHTPVYRLIYWLPGFRGVRAPARLVVLGDFGLAALAAYGLDRIRHSRRGQIAVIVMLTAALVLSAWLLRAVSVPADRWERTRNALWMAVALCCLGLLWLWAVARRYGTRWLGGVAVAILALDLILSGSMVEVQREDPTTGYQHDDVVAFLRRDPGLYRIDSSAASAWQPDAAAVYGLYDIGGVANPLNLATYETYRWSIGARGDRLYGLLGVKYVLADKGSPPGDERLVPVYTAGSDVDIYLNTTAYPMAQLIYQAVEVESAEAALAAVHAPDFDPAQIVVLQEKPMPVQEPGNQPRSISFIEYSCNRLSLQVSTPTPAYLLLSEVYYPGWRATIDSQPTRVLQADYLFRAIYIPPGDHEVRLWFSPSSFWIGLSLSALSWLGLAAWGLAWWKKFFRQRGTT
ncbi:MAG: YfhO family protein [Chloroflexi bacterium]|nr:YfhO family protein [Chloroflexota bacterium]